MHERRLAGNEGDDPYYRPGCYAGGVRSSVSSYFATRQFAQHDFSAKTTFGAKSSTGHRSRPQVTGVIARAIRSGNPLQMLNPLAPAKYGTAEENVVLNPDVPGKWDGIKLLRISF